jgi:hypothetical protein
MIRYSRAAILYKDCEIKIAAISGRNFSLVPGIEA